MEQILGLHAYFAGTLRNGATPDDFRSASDFDDSDRWVPKRRIRFSAGWGTLLTNDFRNCNPQGNDGFNPVGLVCKLTEVEGRPAVKLSDNYSKALGDAERSRALPARLWRGRCGRRAGPDVAFASGIRVGARPSLAHAAYFKVAFHQMPSLSSSAY